jgi:hypothetical protein
MQSWQWYVDGAPVAVKDAIAIGIDRIAEASIPFEQIGAAPLQAVNFYVELLESQQSRDRAPREGSIVFARPTPEFEQVMWDV